MNKYSIRLYIYKCINMCVYKQKNMIDAYKICVFIRLDSKKTMALIWRAKNIPKRSRIANILGDKGYFVDSMVVQAIL